VHEPEEKLVNGREDRCRWHWIPATAAGSRSELLTRSQRRRWRRWLLYGHQEVASAGCTGSEAPVRLTRIVAHPMLRTGSGRGRGSVAAAGPETCTR
jgi:hypothetical protein